MKLKIPKSDKYQWTQHAQWKMRQYGLSPQRVIRVIRNPERTETGIVKNTIAVMQPSSTKNKNGKKIWSQEIWAMYQTRRAGNHKFETLNSKKILNFKYQILNTKIKIISAWRYPGVSPKKDPIPAEILQEIKSSI
jgi:hypothetical protein